jgi:hypothetical protein
MAAIQQVGDGHPVSAVKLQAIISVNIEIVNTIIVLKQRSYRVLAVRCRFSGYNRIWYDGRGLRLMVVDKTARITVNGPAASGIVST